MRRVGLVLQPYTARPGPDEVSLAPEHLCPGVVQVLDRTGISLAGTARVELPREELGRGGPWHRVSLANRRLGREVGPMSRSGTFVLGLLGNCIGSWGMLAGLQHPDPQGRPRRVGLIWIDAHGDFNTPETTVSGWLGGMPLSVAAGQSLTPMRITAGVDPPIATGDIVMMGPRDVDPLEQALIDECRITTVSAADLAARAEAMHEAVRRLAKAADVIYLHVDLDILDSSAIPGSFFETPGGLAPDEVAAALRDLMRYPRVAALGIASFPTAERGSQTSMRSTLTLVRAAMEGLRARGNDAPGP